MHGASIENDESTDSSLGRQSLSREDTMESLLSSPDMDSAIWSVNLEALTGSWKSPRRFSLEVVEIRSEILQRYRNKKTEEAFLLRLLEDTWLNKDDSIDSVFMPGPGSSTGSKTLEQNPTPGTDPAKAAGVKTYVLQMLSSNLASTLPSFLERPLRSLDTVECYC